MPLLPFVALQMSATAFEIGCVQAVYSLAQIFGTLVFGYCSDLADRRTVLLVCLFFSSVSLALLGLADDITKLIAFRAMSGFFAGTVGVCQALVTDLSEGDHLTSAMGKLGAATGLGLVLGPGVGGLLGMYGFLSTCLFGSSLTLINFLAGLWTLPVTSKTNELDDGSVSAFVTAHEYFHAFRQDPRILWLFTMYCFQQISVGVLMGIAALYFHEVYGMKGTELGFLYCIAGLSMAVAQTAID